MTFDRANEATAVAIPIWEDTEIECYNCGAEVPPEDWHFLEAD